MATQSTTYRVGSSDGFSVFSLSNEEKSETSLSRISEDVQNPFKSLSLNQFSTTMPTAKPYSCKQCGQAFSRPHNLKSHLATHSSLRPYKCGTCTYHFRRHHDLKRHQKLHTGEKPYTCHKCHRSFARLDALNRHQRSEGMNACTTGHLKKNLESNKSASPHANSGGADERPTIPHLKLTYRSSQPYCPPKTPPHVFESSPIKSGTLSGPTRLSSSPSAFVTPIKELPLTKPSPAATHRSPSWSPPGTSLLHSSRVLPLSNELASSFSNQYEKLEIENKALKQEINMMFQGQLGNLKARVYDLEVENRVLRSLLVDDEKSLVKKTRDIDLELQQQKEKIIEYN